MNKVVTTRRTMVRVRENFTPRNEADSDNRETETIRNEIDSYRKSCCSGGTAFFDALKAMFTRQLFLIHSLVAIWRAADILDESYWFLALSLLGVLIETAVVLVHRKGKEWNWFQPSVLLYLISVVPPIWLLEIDNLETLQNGHNASRTEEEASSGSSLNMTKRDWLVALEQSLLVLIIIGRWLIPKGDLTRDQLSALLITNLGTASDIVDFYSILDEPQAIVEDDNLDLVYVVLVFWTWSLLQFPFVRTSTKKRDKEDECDDDDDDNSYNVTDEHSRMKKIKRYLAKVAKTLEVFFETEGWAIFVSLLMQDGPFFIIRILSIFHYRILTYTNYFFATKNALIVALQVYRIVSIYLDHKTAKEREIEQKRNFHNYKPKYKDYEDLVWEKKQMPRLN